MKLSLPKALRALFVLAALFSLVMALLPQPPAFPGGSSDKTNHIMAFAVLSVFSALAYPQRRLGEIFLALAAFGALIEVLQLIPALGRQAELKDWLADCAACVAALSVCGVARRIARQSPRASAL